MSSVNKVILVGNLGNDPDVRRSRVGEMPPLKRSDWSGSSYRPFLR